MQILVLFCLIVLGSRQLTCEARRASTPALLEGGLLFEHHVFEIFIALLYALFEGVEIFVVAIHVFLFYSFGFELLY